MLKIATPNTSFPSTDLSHVLPADGALVPATQDPHPGGTLETHRMIAFSYAIGFHGTKTHHAHFLLLCCALHPGHSAFRWHLAWSLVLYGGKKRAGNFSRIPIIKEQCWGWLRKKACAVFMPSRFTLTCFFFFWEIYRWLGIVGTREGVLAFILCLILLWRKSYSLFQKNKRVDYILKVTHVFHRFNVYSFTGICFIFSKIFNNSRTGM